MPGDRNTAPLKLTGRTFEEWGGVGGWWLGGSDVQYGYCNLLSVKVSSRGTRTLIVIWPSSPIVLD